MNWRCDVYVYGDVHGGWTTHVASRRRVVPPIPDIVNGAFLMAMRRWAGAEWDQAALRAVYPSRWRELVYRAWLRVGSFWHNYIHLGSLRLIPLRKIGLPYDGQSFSDSTPGVCAERLMTLRDAGYCVPSGAIGALLDEDRRL